MAIFYDINGKALETSSATGSTAAEQTIYLFSDMEMVDADGMATSETDVLRLKHSESGIKVTVPDVNTEHTITFNNLSIKPRGKNWGIWAYLKRKAKGVTLGGNGNALCHNMVIDVKVNGTTVRTIAHNNHSGGMKSGLNYYYIPAGDAGTVVNSISFTLQNTTMAGGEIILDSIEIGYRMDTPHCILNFDSIGGHFDGTTRELLNKYGLHGTFDYWSATTDGGTDSVIDGTYWTTAEEAKDHFAMISEGMDYGIYSRYLLAEAPPAYDADGETYPEWLEYAKLMYSTGNSMGIFCPSTVHSSGHVSGEDYARAMVDAGFLVVRGDLHQGTWDNRSMFVYFDPVNYREITPYYLTNYWTADDTMVDTVKNLIDIAIEQGQNFMLMAHSICPEDYDHSSDTINIGYAFMDAVFAYLAEKKAAGLIKVSNTVEFLEECAPSLYEEWRRKKAAKEHEYVVNKLG